METWMWAVWLGILILALILEAATAALVSIWFAAGALVAIVFSLIPDFTPWWAVLLIFLGVSGLAFLLIRPIWSKRNARNKVPSNVDEMIGKKGVIKSPIEPLKSGEIEVNGIIWTAIANEENESFAINEVARIVAIEGNKLLVAKLKGEN